MKITSNQPLFVTSGSLMLFRVWFQLHEVYISPMGMISTALSFSSLGLLSHHFSGLRHTSTNSSPPRVRLSHPSGILGPTKVIQVYLRRLVHHETHSNCLGFTSTTSCLSHLRKFHLRSIEGLPQSSWKTSITRNSTYHRNIQPIWDFGLPQLLCRLQLSGIYPSHLGTTQSTWGSL
jgi:hypothetical protein